MRRRYGAYAALLAIFILLFSGCDALIGNVFKEANWGQPSAEKLKSADTATLLSDSGISSGSVSNTFIQTVISDDATKTQVLATLQNTVSTGSASEAQAAQALILNIELADSGASDIINNVSTSIGSVVEQLSGGGSPDYGSIIGALLPDTSNLADVVNSLGSLSGDYDTLAASINSNGNTLDQSVVAGAAQTALLSVIVSNSTPGGSYTTVGDAAAALVADIQANSSNPDYSLTLGNYFQSGPDLTDASLTGSGSTLYTLFNAAGMGDLLSQLSGS
jgi:hypothetical protein